MKINKTGAVALAASALLLAASTANATVTSTAILSAIRYEIFDLNPLDGIDASISFQQATPITNSQIVTSTDYHPIFDGTLGHSSVSTSSSFVESSISSTDWTKATFSAFASTEPGSGDHGDSLIYQFINFTLGAGTGVNWYADSTVSNDCPGGYTNCYGDAIANMAFDYNSPYTTQSKYDQNIAGALVHQNYSQKELMVTILNNSPIRGLSVRGEMSLFADIRSVPANQFPAVNPVPEPETYALMLAGLGIVSVIARRRKLK